MLGRVVERVAHAAALVAKSASAAPIAPIIFRIVHSSRFSRPFLKYGPALRVPHPALLRRGRGLDAAEPRPHPSANEFAEPSPLVLAASAAGVVTGGVVRPLSEQSGANDACDDERDS